ncbi:MAG TPA: hypothetical protein O0X97_06110 [Methanocorpusculum sp.]|nr:hypothetical protein [Methanocorpusculum sp.]
MSSEKNMELICKEDKLTFDDLNSYIQLFSIIVNEKQDDGTHIEIIEYFKNLKTLTFDRFDIKAVVGENKEILQYSKTLKYAIELGDEDTPHIIINELSAGTVYLNAGDVEQLFPAQQYAA